MKKIISIFTFCIAITNLVFAEVSNTETVLVCDQEGKQYVVSCSYTDDDNETKTVILSNNVKTSAFQTCLNKGGTWKCADCPGTGSVTSPLKCTRTNATYSCSGEYSYKACTLLVQRQDSTGTFTYDTTNNCQLSKKPTVTTTSSTWSTTDLQPVTEAVQAEGVITLR